MSNSEKQITPLSTEQYFRLLERIKDAENNLNTAKQMIVRAQNKLFTMKNSVLLLDPEYKKLKEEEIESMRERGSRIGDLGHKKESEEK